MHLVRVRVRARARVRVRVRVRVVLMMAETPCTAERLCATAEPTGRAGQWTWPPSEKRRRPPGEGEG